MSKHLKLGGWFVVVCQSRLGQSLLLRAASPRVSAPSSDCQCLVAVFQDAGLAKTEIQSSWGTSDICRVGCRIVWVVHVGVLIGEVEVCFEMCTTVVLSLPVRWNVRHAVDLRYLLLSITQSIGEITKCT